MLRCATGSPSWIASVITWTPFVKKEVHGRGGRPYERHAARAARQAKGHRPTGHDDSKALKGGRGSHKAPVGAAAKSDSSRLVRSGRGSGDCVLDARCSRRRRPAVT